MVLAVDVLGLTLLTTIVPAALMVYAGWQNAEKPGARWFTLLVVGIAGWSSVYGISLISNDAGITLAAINLRFFFTDLVSVSWFLLALEYARRARLPDRSPLLVLFVFPLLNELVAWVVPEYMFAAWRMDPIGVFHADFGPWFYVQTLFSYVLVVGGIALLVRDYRNSQGIRRNQTAVLVAGAMVAFLANVLFVIGFTPYPDLDLTPLAFLVTTVIFGWGLFRYRLLELVPIARKTVLDQMQDAVVTLDEDGRVVDVNAAAADLFEVEESAAVGTHGEDFFADYPRLIERFGTAVDVETEIEFTTNGENRYFHLDISPVSAGSDVIDGRVVVLRDVTQLKEREQELDLLKQVLSRVLRHNIRNDVSVVNGYAEEIAEQNDGETAELAAKIIEKSDDLATRSHKAASVERVLSATGDPLDLDLVDVIQEALDRDLEGFGDFDATLDLPENCYVRALPTLPIALRNVIENAIGHSDSATPQIEISVACDEESATVEIRDDGPGIPEGELSVFEDREETQLHHSSGIGLWLVVLIVRRSGGSVSFENTDDGAVVRLTLDCA